MSNLSKKELLAKIIEKDGGGITQQHLNSFAPNAEGIQLIQKLISTKYIEAYVRRERVGLNNVDLQYYRVTEKGYFLFEPLYKRLWYFFTNDIAKILSLIAIIISIIVGLRQIGII